MENISSAVRHSNFSHVIELFKIFLHTICAMLKPALFSSCMLGVISTRMPNLSLWCPPPLWTLDAWTQCTCVRLLVQSSHLWIITWSYIILVLRWVWRFVGC